MRKSSFSLAAALQVSMDSFTLGSVHGHERSGTGPNEDKALRAFTGHHPRRGDRPKALMPLAGGKRRSPAGPPQKRSLTLTSLAEEPETSIHVLEKKAQEPSMNTMYTTAWTGSSKTEPKDSGGDR